MLGTHLRPHPMLVLQPFEPELDWGQFSMPLAEKGIPRMHEVIEAVQPARLGAMQARGALRHGEVAETFVLHVFVPSAPSPQCPLMF